MEARVRYKDVVLEARPQQLDEDGRWTTRVFVEHDQGDSVTPQLYSTASTWATREEAIEYSWGFGRQIVDGAVKASKHVG